MVKSLYVLVCISKNRKILNTYQNTDTDVTKDDLSIIYPDIGERFDELVSVGSLDIDYGRKLLLNVFNF